MIISTKQLLTILFVLNIVMVFLLIYKQNKIIKELYVLQELQQQKESLLDEHRALTVQLQTNTQLSAIEQHGQEVLQLKSVGLRDVATISMSNQSDNHVAI